ncbi:MAG: hypothetical protein ACRDHP_04115, partial [Ktedonobacterales bacterium]
RHRRRLAPPHQCTNGRVAHAQHREHRAEDSGTRKVRQSLLEGREAHEAGDHALPYRIVPARLAC